ncbi:hypothetical protein YEP4_01953 [Yersinia enterocolitica subsp. palearctica YE-P4]|uniref:Uncharacterized protein n=1 Tax=Yersinia enterocolitica subsp. palearctica serotype O:3 (strain DSM 13030 / CIP 106945 / Y11) TaxID=930944 RepID=A0A0H3NWD9_YERE1|nr:hypothetical protein YE149_01952 [Yersinia enterocolitica subsp. palearctica YE-149]EOR80796.1 hypothetical protein YEP1_01952 [Yersinia enterocolitica subsp. palearctica YE-P1]EOR81390.1 hypothetical protein YE150_01940 [Yersinia enterocolitica subsp. palearctica YE-150]EOR83623.1 hypothetical protein YEP4_01953 [Yersinia enterocolitica subsp. palearctica YE-P4]CBY27770.1 hypothetical protein Y11_04111 [Yersinia enterocolitica subsp. palearctica Y11]CCO67283.1 hypothetical protein D322_387
MARVEPPGMGLRRLYDLLVLSVAGTLSKVSSGISPLFYRKFFGY